MEAFEVLFGGSRGPGKSAAAIAKATMGNRKLPREHPCHSSYLNHNRFRGLILRNNATDLKDYVSEATEFYRHFGLEKTSGDPPIFKFPSGATIYTNHLKSEDAFTKYKGMNLHLLIIEELTLIDLESTYLKVLGSIRSVYPEIIPQVFCTSNPDGNGSAWVRKRFIHVKAKDGSMVPWGRKMRDPISGLTRVFIPGKLADNPSLGPEYKAVLMLQDEKTRRAWIDGDWDALTGAYFDQFRPNGPLQAAYPPEPEWARHVIKRGSVPLASFWPRYIGVDWGFKDNSAALWLCNNQQDGRLHVYDELITNRVGAEELGVMIARKTEHQLVDQPDYQVPLYLSHDAFAQRDVTKTTAELIQKGIEAVLGRGSAVLAVYKAENPESELQIEDVPVDFDEQAKIIIHRAGKERVGVWQYLRSLLRFEPMMDLGEPDPEYARKLLDGPDGHIRYESYLRAFEKKKEVLPGILFWDNCHRIIDEMAGAIHDERKPEDILDARVGTSHMDALQALRHVLMMIRRHENRLPYRQFMADRMSRAEKYSEDPNIMGQVYRKASADYEKYAGGSGMLRLPRASMGNRRVM